MKIAIIHEMLVKLGGAEKVVSKMLQIFPEADLFTLIYDEKQVSKDFPKEKVKVAGLTQRIYKIFRNQRFCLPYMPRAIESLDFSQYDVVIASSSGFAHGAITKPETKFIVYYHSPARYLWDWTNEYKRDIGWNSGIKGFIMNSMMTKLRRWDFIASKRNDISLANSSNVVKRIKKYFKNDAKHLYPPVETKRFQKKLDENFILSDNYKLPEKYFIIISALTEFKKIEIAIKGFKGLNDNLVIVGDGNYRKNLEELSGNNLGKNIFFLGKRFGDDLVYIVQNSSGLIFPGEEDFGIVPIEANAAGKPVFALKTGGLAETLKENITGSFFFDDFGRDFEEEFKKFTKLISEGKFDSEIIKKEAFNYDESLFEEKLKEIVFEEKVLSK